MSDNRNNQITLTLSQMKQISRYEITFKNIIENTHIKRVEFICPEVYTFTLDDLYAALQNIKKSDSTIEEFEEYWYCPLQDLWEEFDFDRACGYLEDEDDTPEELKGYQHIMISETLLL